MWKLSNLMVPLKKKKKKKKNVPPVWPQAQRNDNGAWQDEISDRGKESVGFIGLDMARSISF